MCLKDDPTLTLAAFLSSFISSKIKGEGKGWNVVLGYVRGRVKIRRCLVQGWSQRNIIITMTISWKHMFHINMKVQSTMHVGRDFNIVCDWSSLKWILVTGEGGGGVRLGKPMYSWINAPIMCKSSFKIWKIKQIFSIANSNPSDKLLVILYS